MKTIELHLKTITPMFMAGVDGRTFELRSPSIKGALRFWWRAQYWGKESGKIAPKDMEAVEGNKFGTTSSNGRRSRVSIHVKSEHLQGTMQKLPNHPIQVSSRGRTFPINIPEYLAYGTYDYQRGKGNVFNRQYLPGNQNVTVTLRIHDDALTHEVLTSFYFLSVFGGLGAKSHNGFGIFDVVNSEMFAEHEIPYTYPFPDKSDLATFARFNAEIPSFTALSKEMKIFKLNTSYSTWDACLAELGKRYREARGSLEPKHKYERRQYIAAPIIAGKSQKSFLDRRAKPYFLRVVKRGESAFDGYIVYLPSQYCPKLEKDHFKKTIDHTKVDNNFQIYCNQFNTLLGRQMGVVL